ncbi:MAG TPA: hypothetical protein VG456_25700 [Candidatus Sulfopaludibacter sp.]|nr:hypothetical protein [Candidatus Sulfopaludibacter sp.]
MKHRPVLWCLLALAIVNLAIVGKLFGIEYLAHDGPVEGSFIAIARIMAKYPGEWNWWPFWGCGMPFETAYLPVLHGVVAVAILLTHLSAARAFHVVIAAVYAGSAVAVFWMALVLSRKLVASFIAALGYSCFSFANLLVPEIRADSGGLWNLRRLQILVSWGEAPHTLALALLPVAVVCFSYAFTTGAPKWKILAGLSAAAVVLSNAFGIVALGTALVCWMVAFRVKPWWKAPVTGAVIGLVSYCWISPWLSPAMIRAIRASAPTVGGDFRYRTESWIALAAMVAVFLLIWLVLSHLKAPAHVQFFGLFGYIQTAFVLIWYGWRVAVIPQPGRYQLEMDLALLPAVVFAAAWALERVRPRVRQAVASVAIVALAAQCGYAAYFGSQLIQPTEPHFPVEYEMAQWLDQNRHGERAFLGGEASMIFNTITDNPQLKGNHDQQAVNPFLAIVGYTIYAGTNAGARDAQYSIFWLKAYGTPMVSVPGPDSGDYYKPYAHPHKFDGVLPAVWRKGDNTVYQVPGVGASLAHVIPAAAVVGRTPIHGLDIEPAQAYVAALEDARYPPATFHWKNMSEAEIHAKVEAGQVIAAQVTYDRGWEAWVNGRRQPLRRDGLGLMVIDTDCRGSCDVALRFTGGWEHVLTRLLSLTATLIAIGYAVWSRRRVWTR